MSCQFEDCNRLLASYARKSLEEIIEGIATFKIIEQILYRHSSAGKARFATQAIGMHGHGVCEHLRAIAVAVFSEKCFGLCHGYITSTIAAMTTLNKLKTGDSNPEILERS